MLLATGCWKQSYWGEEGIDWSLKALFVLLLRSEDGGEALHNFNYCEEMQSAVMKSSEE